MLCGKSDSGQSNERHVACSPWRSVENVKKYLDLGRIRDIDEVLLRSVDKPTCIKVTRCMYLACSMG